MPQPSGLGGSHDALASQCKGVMEAWVTCRVEVLGKASENELGLWRPGMVSGEVVA